MFDPTHASLEVTSWADLTGLPEDMAQLDEQFRRISEHAREWVCNTQGFAPSPVCLLRPLGEFMDGLAEAVTAAEQVVHREWDTLAAGVDGVVGDLQATDRLVAAALPVV